MFKRLFTDAIIKILRAYGRIKSVYPAKLRNKTRANFVESVKRHNQK